MARLSWVTGCRPVMRISVHKYANPRTSAAPAGPSNSRKMPSRRDVPTSHWPIRPPGPWALKSAFQPCRNQGWSWASPAPHPTNSPIQPSRPCTRMLGADNLTPPKPSSRTAMRKLAAPKKKKCIPAMIAPTGPMKFWRGLSSEAVVLKGTQAGRSLGV